MKLLLVGLIEFHLDGDKGFKISEELQKGYLYKDSVLRHSMVKVAN